MSDVSRFRKGSGRKWSNSLRGPGVVELRGAQSSAHDERMIQNIQSTAKVASHSLAFWPSCLAGLAPSLEGFFTKRSQIEAIEEILYMNVSTNMTCSVGGVCKPVQTSG